MKTRIPENDPPYYTGRTRAHLWPWNVLQYIRIVATNKYSSDHEDRVDRSPLPSSYVL